MEESAEAPYDYLLTYTARRLELRQTGRAGTGPIVVDFVGGPFGYRRMHNGGRQPLARAIGVRNLSKPYVIDMTAGLGRDAFVLAALGCRVSMLERSPIVHALLADGLARAADFPALAPVCERLSLCQADGIFYLNPLAGNRPDVGYLDPMYPHRRQSALNKKEMRVLRDIVGDDDDAPALLAAALRVATRRVVVKRPRLAPPLEGPPPVAQIKGSTTRYDIYRVS